jgi:hypothetical protein
MITFGPRSVSSTVTFPADFREAGGSLGIPCLEDLDDARQAVRDVRAGDAARVERPASSAGCPARRSDCAAMMPTASPTSPHPAGGEEDAVAGLAHAVLRSCT